jgi:NADH:ubiquinone oxidoreductase subunit 6 (subunit J)
MDGGYEVLAFYVLAALTLGSALGVMLARGLFHAVLLLVVTFVGIAGFFVLLSAEFLAMAQIVIYVGAISVLLLFAVLLTPGESRRNPETNMLAPAVLLSVAMAAVFLFVIVDADWTQVNDSPVIGARELGRALVGPWVVPFEVASVLLTAALVGATMLARTPEEEAEDALS